LNRATVASIGRLAYVKKMQDNPDVTWTQASAAVWSCIEINLGIICNCTALLKPLARRYFGWISTRGGSSDEAVPSYGQPRSGLSNKWRPDGVKHSYQLHSYDKGGRDSGMRDGEGGGDEASAARGYGKQEDGGRIVRVDEYSVQFDGKSRNRPSSDGGSEAASGDLGPL
jgi:hypothetical protein